MFRIRKGTECRRLGCRTRKLVDSGGIFRIAPTGLCIRIRVIHGHRFSEREKERGRSLDERAACLDFSFMASVRSYMPGKAKKNSEGQFSHLNHCGVLLIQIGIERTCQTQKMHQNSGR